MSRRSRLAGIGLVVVLFGVSAFAVWSSTATSTAVSKAVAANAVSDDFAKAANAVGAEESLERKYRLEPGPDVRERFDAAAAALVTSLGLVRHDGDADDRAVVDEALLQHRSYLGAIDRLFAAVDRGDTAGSLQIDSDEVDPTFALIETAVLRAAETSHATFVDQVTHLRRLDTLMRRLTPLVFVAGLALAAVLASITRGHRRQLGRERAHAVHDSLHDSLTGLPNRKLFAERCEQALNDDKANGTRCALLLFDLDRFKEINDTFGHHYGDELLRHVGPRLTGALHAGGTVARLGGDEFAVLLTDIQGANEAHQIALRLRDALKESFRVEDVDLDVEASIGFVISGPDGSDASTLLQHADIAMYVAKARSCGVFAYDSTIDVHSPAKLALLGDLRRGMDRGELALHYQPKVSLSTGDIVGVEALVRWNHPRHGQIMPDNFIPLAEHTGLIGPLTRYVLNAAMEQIRIWMDDGHPLTVAVNLSARNLLDNSLPGEIAVLLASHGVPAERLEIEVTESALMTDPIRAQQLLDHLTGLGIRISIDDFGAGYTSLGQLRTLPVSELKIDRSFVAAMSSDPASTVIVQSVIELGHNLGLTVVAEGVEAARTLTSLAEMGCDVAQGYFIRRPDTPTAINMWCIARGPSALLNILPTRAESPVVVRGD